MADEDRERIQISLAQVAASSLAAVSAAVVCSFFGVAGTVIGTAAASVVATVGSALYSYSLRRTKARLRRLHQAGAAAPPFREVVKTMREQGIRLWSQLPLRLLGLSIAGVFIVAIAAVTVIELGLGRPLATALGGGGSGDTGVSLANIGSHRASHRSHTPSPRPTGSTPAAPPTSASPAPRTPTSTPAPTPTATKTTPGSIISTLLNPPSGG